jgi:hypothetical protein
MERNAALRRAAIGRLGIAFLPLGRRGPKPLSMQRNAAPAAQGTQRNRPQRRQFMLSTPSRPRVSRDASTIPVLTPIRSTGAPGQTDMHDQRFDPAVCRFRPVILA